MAFRLIQDLTGSPMVIRKYLVTDSEAIARGEALKFVSGRLTMAAAADPVAAIATHAVAAGTDKECEVIIVTAAQIYEVEYTGTPDAGFVEGCNSTDIDATATKLNAADIVGGACAILRKDTTAGKCQVMFKLRQLN
jgi:hypothetical protein